MSTPPHEEMGAFSEARRNFIACALSFVFFLFIYGATARSNAQVSDEVAMIASGVSLAEDGDLAIDEWQWLQNKANIGIPGRGGYLYSKYFPGNVLVSSLIYKITAKELDIPYKWGAPELDPSVGFMELAKSNRGARMALKTNAFFGAMAMTALLFLLFRYFNWKTAILTVALMGLCTDWFYQSRGFMSEVGAGALMIVSMCFMAYRRPYGSSLALGLSLLFRPPNLIALPIWGKAVWDKGLKTIWSAFFIFAGLVGLALFNWIRFASFLNFGYGSATFKLRLAYGLFGILLSPGRSVFIYSPLLTLAIPGAWLFYKKDKALTLVCSYIVVSYIIMAALWQNWDGGMTWGSRLLTPILPVLGLFLAPTIEYAWGKRGDLSVILFLAALGFCVQALALTNDPVQTMVKFVIAGDIPYAETLFTIKNSWIALQIRNLHGWNFCNLDAYTLRQWFGNCP